MSSGKTKKYSYYPGCSQEVTNRAYDVSSRNTARVLGLEMFELDDWNCCGATAYYPVRDKKYFMSYCGSYCRLCDWHTGKIKRTFIRAAGMVNEFGFAKLFKNDVDRENLMLGLSRIAGRGIAGISRKR